MTADAPTPVARFAPRRVAEVVLRLGVGGLFLYAAAAKLWRPDFFAEILLDYEILPLGAINLVAVWLPMFELVTAVCLLLGIWLRASALSVAGQLALFIGAIAYALHRGIGLHCGCFSTDTGGDARTWVSLWQEIAMLIAACALWALSWPKQGNRQTDD